MGIIILLPRQEVLAAVAQFAAGQGTPGQGRDFLGKTLTNILLANMADLRVNFRLIGPMQRWSRHANKLPNLGNTAGLRQLTKRICAENIVSWVTN